MRRGVHDPVATAFAQISIIFEQQPYQQKTLHCPARQIGILHSLSDVPDDLSNEDIHFQMGSYKSERGTRRALDHIRNSS